MIPTKPGVNVATLHPVFARRVAAVGAFAGGRASSGVRSYAKQAALYRAYRNGTGNTAADPDRQIGWRVVFAGTAYEVHGEAQGSWHMEQPHLVAAMFPRPGGWGYAVDWDTATTDMGRLALAAPWNVPGWRVDPPSAYGVCRDVGPTARNPNGEPWHLKPDPRVPSTIFDLPATEAPDMTDDERRLLTEAVTLLRRLRTELIGPDRDDDPTKPGDQDPVAMVPAIVKKLGA